METDACFPGGLISREIDREKPPSGTFPEGGFYDGQTIRVSDDVASATLRLASGLRWRPSGPTPHSTSPGGRSRSTATSLRHQASTEAWVPAHRPPPGRGRSTDRSRGHLPGASPTSAPRRKAHTH